MWGLFNSKGYNSKASDLIWKDVDQWLQSRSWASCELNNMLGCRKKIQELVFTFILIRKVRIQFKLYWRDYMDWHLGPTFVKVRWWLMQSSAQWEWWETALQRRDCLCSAFMLAGWDAAPASPCVRGSPAQVEVEDVPKEVCTGKTQRMSFVSHVTKKLWLSGR